MNKNDICETQITDMTDKGLGVSKVDGMAVFVKDAAVGDVLKIRITSVKKNYAYAIIEETVFPSYDRIEPDCPVFFKCGGCAFRHISYDAELRLKETRVFETMKRIGGIEMPPQKILSGEPLCYRNKAQYPIGKDGPGFYAPRSHRVIAAKECPLSPPEFSVAANEFFAFLKEKNIPVYDEETKKGLVRHFYLRKGFATGEIQAVAVINGEKLPFEEEFVKRLRDLFGEALCSVVINTNRKDTNVILGDKCRTVWGSDRITDILCGVRVRLSPFSFYQVNRAMAERLYKKAAEYAEPQGKKILDLYCGTGTIGLSMANAAAEVVGVEIVPDAVKDAAFNAEQNGIKNARFICGNAADAAEKLSRDGFLPDVVILDPPRKGCDEALLHTVAEDFAPERIVYISCDVATLARDTAVLEGLGYKLTEYTPADLFPRTAHVETVVLMSRA